MELPTIKQYVLASYPCLFIESLDREGVENTIRSALLEIDDGGYRRNAEGIKVTPTFATWTPIGDFRLTELKPRTTTPQKPISKTFQQVLEMVRDSNDAMAVVVHNVRGMFNQMPLIQLFIDAAMAARTKFSNIFIVGQQFDIPPELANVIHVVDYALPNKEQLIDICMDKVVLPNLSNLKNLVVPAEGSRPPIGETKKVFIKRRVKEENYPVFEAAAKAATGLDPMSAENAFALSLVVSGELSPTIIQEQKKQAIRRSDVLEFIPLEETMSSVGGFGNYRKWLSKRHGSFTDEAAEFGVRPPKGVLFVGVPGGGKSLAAKATASELRVPLLRFDMSRIFSSLVGSSEARMGGSLKIVEAVAPCVLFIDEVEKAVAGSRSGEHDSGVSARVVGQFLQWRNDTKAPVFLCVTCNNIHAIPPEFYRPGRIDAIFHVGLPNEGECIEILVIHLKKRGKTLEGIDLLKVAKTMATAGFTGAEIELVVIEAIFDAFTNNKAPVSTELLLEAVSNVVPQSVRNKEEMDALEVWAKERAMSVSGDYVPIAKRELGTRPIGSKPMRNLAFEVN